MRNKWILIYSCLTVLAVYLLFAVCTDKGVRVIMENKVFEINENDMENIKNAINSDQSE